MAYPEQVCVAELFIGDTYEQELDYLKQWLVGRLDWMDANIPGECTPVSSINDINQEVLVLSPNPAKSSFRIRVLNNDLQQFDLRINNANGVLVKAQKAVANGEEIDIVALPAGVYIVSVSNQAGGQYQEKLVISE